MKYYSLHHKAPMVSFREAVIQGIAPDRGLYFPKEIPTLSAEFFQQLLTADRNEIAFEVIRGFVGDTLPKSVLKKIISETLVFDFPMVSVENNISALELYHGPTLAFKDVGARFMARCLGYFNQDTSHEKVTVLVATSGDTGGAVADGFYDVPGVEVVILYPSGKVSDIQEKQLTTLGKNIHAVEVAGSFDDCQEMVKQAFLDPIITKARTLTSANSINVARWLPQMFYYFFAFQQLPKEAAEVVFSVPSGNYGNICAGMMAKRLGLPISHFIAATNVNDVVPQYLLSGAYQPQQTKATIANAMDVGDPSNFIRIQALYGNNYHRLKEDLSGFAFTDEQTRSALVSLYRAHSYQADPHGAIGYLALQKYLQEREAFGVFLETAHPVKFLDVLPEALSEAIAIPENIQRILPKKKKAEKISTYSQLNDYLLTNA
ncbi:threonine synthase [Altibacter sp. HG106]|uniref:threonine synthase n=1 Tax=Altibacter sp. HG106 TaxID=3023937 RepID=UPI0023501312|nr:threonine synthase [Altibacter sp. HG106]MDC7994375.1 threonine synthase [Altibacter sp. HG106]